MDRTVVNKWAWPLSWMGDDLVQLLAVWYGAKKNRHHGSLKEKRGDAMASAKGTWWEEA